MGPEYYTQEGMRAQLEKWLRRFREDQPGTIMEWVPLYLHDCDFQKRTMTVCVDPTPWMADRTGGMSNGAFSVALTSILVPSVPSSLTLMYSRRSMGMGRSRDLCMVMVGVMLSTK